jgi:hypothetical protein
MSIQSATQFDIIRSYSKDKFYRLKQFHVIKHIYLLVTASSFSSSSRKQFLLKYANEFELISDLIYYIVTTGTNRQTFGQEYFNTIYFNNRTQRPLNKMVSL